MDVVAEAGKIGVVESFSEPLERKDEPVRLTAMGNDLSEECVDAECFGLARLNAKGSDPLRTELGILAEDGSLHPEGLVDLFYRLFTKGHEIYDAYVPGQWLDVDDTTNLLPAGKFL